MQEMHEDSNVVYSRHTGLSKRYVASVLQYLSAMTYSPEEKMNVLQQAGIPPDAADDPSIVITAEQELAAFAHMATQDESGFSAPVLGYHIAEASPASSFGIVGLAAQTSANLFEAITTTARFPELIWGTTRNAIQFEDQRTIMSFHFDRPARSSIAPELIDLLENASWRATF